MNKKTLILSISLLFLSFVCGASTVFARAKSKILYSPSAYAGSTTQGSTLSITSPSYSSVKGDRVYFYLNEVFPLDSNNVVPSSSRKAFVRLYEDDAPPNDDDLVKTYRFGFSEYQMIDIYESRTIHDYGNIDSEGDPTAELFITLEMTKISGDTSRSNGAIFRYHFEID